MPKIFVFPLMLEIRHNHDRYQQHHALQGLGFSGVLDFEDDLHRLIPVAFRHGISRFFTHYPLKGLAVATSRPHFDNQEQPFWGFQKTWFHKQRRYITRNELLENCPSLSKFNDCRTCQFQFGSLPCFAKALPSLRPTGPLEEDFLRTDDLQPAYRYGRHNGVSIIRRTKPVVGSPDMFWVPAQHVENYQRRYRIVWGVSQVIDPVNIENRIKRASDAAREGHKTRGRTAKCPSCYFYQYCSCRRWIVGRCDGPYTREAILEKAMQDVHRVCDRAGLSLDELRYFINVGGHEVYPKKFRMVFRGLTSDFQQAEFHSTRGNYFERVNLDVARTWLNARYWYKGRYTSNTDFVHRHEIDDEFLAAYLEIVREGRFKTGDGWTPYSSIDYVRGSTSGLEVSFFSRNCNRYIRSYATLFNKLPRRLSTVYW